MSDHESAVYMSAWSIDFYHHDWLTCSIAQVSLPFFCLWPTHLNNGLVWWVAISCGIFRPMFCCSFSHTTPAWCLAQNRLAVGRSVMIGVIRMNTSRCRFPGYGATAWWRRSTVVDVGRPSGPGAAWAMVGYYDITMVF